jgi:hypothetical protein
MLTEIDMSKVEPATRKSWPNLKPLPAQHARLSLQRAYSEQEYELVSTGFVPQGMEDRWFIFAEEGRLYLHRSWTGFCIYQLALAKEGSSYVVVQALVNRDQGQYSGSNDAYDEKLVTFLIDHLLLNKNYPLPVPPDLPSGIATELHHHHVVGAGQRAEAVTKELTVGGMLGWLWRWLIWLIKR